MKIPLFITRAGGRGNRSPATEILLPGAADESHKADAPSLRRRSFYEAYFQDWWLFELSSLAIGTGAFIALIVLLGRYHNKVVPEMGSIAGVGIKINTVVSILATVGRACMLLPIAECINQQKWLWFSGTPRPLVHLDTFDQGSRGAFGSLVMLWKINIRNISSIGALLLVLGLAVDPLSQQLLQYEKRLEPARYGEFKDAEIGRAEAYGDLDMDWRLVYHSEDNENHTSAEPPLFMKAAIQTGISDNSSGIPDLAPFCPTGNCTWNPYASLAVCVRWADVSSKLQRSVVPVPGLEEDQVATWSVDNRTVIGAFQYKEIGLNVSNTATLVTTPGVDYHVEFSGTGAFRDSPAPLAKFFVTYRNGSTSNDQYLGTNYSAMEFILEWCVQEYKTEVKSGVPTTTRLKARKDFQTRKSGRRLFIEMGDDYFYLPISSAYSLPDYLRKTFSGYIVEDNLLGATKTSDAAEAFHSRLKVDTGDSFKPDRASEDADVRTAMVQIVQNVATSMTNAMRQKSTLSATGTVLKEQTFVKVQWGWIAAPMMLATFSLLFVVVTIIQSSGQARRDMVWKSSSMSTLLALNYDLQKVVGGLSSSSKTERVLRDTKASLRQDKQRGWNLYIAEGLRVQRSSPDP